jgi:hypothetical protein
MMPTSFGRFVVGGTLLVPLLASFFAFVSISREADSAAPAAAGAGMRSIRGKCGMCHREIALEWLNSLHAKAFQDTLFLAEAKAHGAEAEGKCFTCHAPQAVRVKGIGQTPGFRTDVREIGVDCQVCHVGLKGKVHAAFKSGGAAHDVEEDAQHRTEALCASCHEAFGTVSEFKQTSFAKQGQSCATCHMPKVKRPSSEGGAAKMVASHTWKGGNDAAMLKKAVKLDATVGPDGTVTAKIGNIGAGHKFPTGIEYREAILLVTVTDASGKELFRKQELFANKTKSGGSDTRLNPGETRTVTVPTGVSSGTFTARLLYKLMPNVPDPQATVIATSTMKS